MACSAALVDHLLTLQGKDHLVAVVPVLADNANGNDGRRSKTVDYDNLDIEALNSIGTAARIIQLTRVAQVNPNDQHAAEIRKLEFEYHHLSGHVMQSGDWSVTLEGLYRISISRANISFPREFWMAAVTAVADGPEASSK